MKNMKRWLALFLTVLMVCSLAACGGGGNGSSAGGASSASSSKEAESSDTGKTGGQEESDDKTAEGEPVVLNIWLAGSGDPIYDKAYRKVFDAYVAENPNVSYELTFIPWGEYFTKLNTGFAGGAAPDLFMLGYGQMGTVQAMDELLPLDDYIPQDWDGWDDFLPNVLKVCQKDGSMYGMFSPATRVYFYRKDVAEQQGVTPEELKVTTREELHALGEKLTVRDANGNTVTSGLAVTTSQNSPEQQFMVEMTYFDEHAGLWDEALGPRFQEDAGVKAASSLNELVTGGVSLVSDPNVATSPVVTGIANMGLYAEGGYNEADAAFPGQIGILDCELPSLLIGNYMAVSKNSKNKETAADMLLHMFSAESCQVFAEDMGQYSGRASLDDAYVALNPEFEYVVKTHANAVPYSFEMNPNFNKMIAILRTALEEIYAGADPKTRLEAAAEEYRAVLAE